MEHQDLILRVMSAIAVAERAGFDGMQKALESMLLELLSMDFKTEANDKINLKPQRVTSKSQEYTIQ